MQPSVIKTVSPDTLLYSFVVVGCNRLDKSDITTSNPSTANLEQLQRTFTDIAQLKPHPDMLFFMGDMVLGYSPDTAVIGSELRAWLKIYEASPVAQAGIRMVPMPGNHEVMSGKNLPAFAAAEAVWRNVMRRYIAGSNGPVAGGADRLTTDQSQLSYSFNFKNSHFLVFNTDAVDNLATVPTNWALQDIIAANNAGAKHVFALGHKPAIPAPTTDGLSNGGTLWTILDQHHGDAMLAAHNHIYYRQQVAGSKPWQIIAGNGGSPLDPSAGVDKQFYGFNLVKVYTNGTTNGKVMTYSYGRDVPSGGYSSPAGNAPTFIRDSVDITWK